MPFKSEALSPAIHSHIARILVDHEDPRVSSLNPNLSSLENHDHIAKIRNGLHQTLARRFDTINSDALELVTAFAFSLGSPVRLGIYIRHHDLVGNRTFHQYAQNEQAGEQFTHIQLNRHPHHLERGDVSVLFPIKLSITGLTKLDKIIAQAATFENRDNPALSNERDQICTQIHSLALLKKAYQLKHQLPQVPLITTTS